MASLAIDMIRCDGGTQMRVGLIDDAVDSYAESMESGEVFPPVVVFHDGKAHWLADGFHRIAARRRVAAKHVGTDRHNKWSVIETDIRAGTRPDAIRFAISANKKNGLRRTNADKQVAVRAALAHPDMQDMSDRAIADEVGVSHQMVASSRRVSKFDTSTQFLNSTHKAVNTKTDIAMRTGVDGKKYPVRQRGQKPMSKVQSSAPDTESAERAPTVSAQQQHVCPTCNGTGYIE